MNKQGNAYTFIYAAVMVVVVAALLAFVSQALKPRQERNEMVAKKIDILQSIKVAATSADAEQKYEEVIGAHSYIVDFSGNKVEGVAFNVDLAVELRKPAEERSEEHTSELQSRPHLVCRLLLEKKNTNPMMPT